MNLNTILEKKDKLHIQHLPSSLEHIDHVNYIYCTRRNVSQFSEDIC